MKLYYDVNKWDGAVELYDMFRLADELKKEEVLRKYIPNYRINLIDAGNIEHLERFHTDLQQVLGMLKCREKREELERYIQKNRDYFECVDVETYQAIRELLHSKKIMKDMSSLKKEEKIDMCRAMEEWYEDAVEKGLEAGRKAGMEAGRKAGMEAGRKAGMKAGIEAGRAEGRIAIIIRMLSKGLDEEEIKGYTDGTDDEIAKAKLEMKAMNEGTGVCG